MKGARLLAVLGVLVSAGCASVPAGEQAAAPAPPSPDAVAFAARTQATDLFYRGKAFALAGDADCAREAFRGALETFRAAARPGNGSDTAFAGELWESVAVYRPALDAAARTGEPERAPAEDPRDSLVAAAPTASPEEFEKARREIAAIPSGVSFDIPIVVNEQVLRAVAFYQFRIPLGFATALKRSGRYMDLMRGILKEEGVPEDLVYVAMVESAFKHHAHSRAAAHGFWQFIEGTGRRYGLRRTREYDERSDAVKSTRAAAAYFRDLYEMFGDWHLAMAAYDAGEGRILKGLQRTGARDFWGLAQGSTLLRETRDYVPFVLATALIAKDPARFGFDVVPDPPIAWDSVTITKPVDLGRVAGALGATLPELQLLNSELRTRSTPHGVPSYDLKVPPGTAALVVARLPGLPAAPEVAEKRITVKKGETLTRVAARAGVSVSELCDWNDIPRTARLQKGTVLVVPSRPKNQPREQLAAKSSNPQGEIRAVPTPASAITRASDVGPFTAAPAAATPASPSAAALPARVEIPAEGFAEARAVPASSAAARKVKHTVKPGETLYSLAARYGTTIDAILRENRLRSAQSLRAGQTLTLTLAVLN
ncbi:MAG: LysM peptidoglycan-binding domain-containing protein [Acidobacteria bacterium]|nr:LysM peptidoglycan-binding domain-containing protein [Acidobacteriota bacterium]